MARVKSLSYYSLAAPSHFVRFSVVKDEKVISTSPRLLSNSNISLARTMKPEVLPLPRTPWEKIQQLLHGDIRPTMLSVREQARLERGPTNPLFAMVRERRELVPDLGIHKTGNFLRPHEGEFLVFANMEEWYATSIYQWMGGRIEI